MSIFQDAGHEETAGTVISDQEELQKIAGQRKQTWYSAELLVLRYSA